MGGFNSLLGGEAAPSNTADGVLTAEWIDYVIHIPGAEPRRIRRPLFDLVGPAARAAAKGEAASPTNAPVAELSKQQAEDRAMAILDRVDVLL